MRTKHHNQDHRQRNGEYRQQDFNHRDDHRFEPFDEFRGYSDHYQDREDDYYREDRRPHPADRNWQDDDDRRFNGRSDNGYNDHQQQYDTRSHGYNNYREGRGRWDGQDNRGYYENGRSGSYNQHDGYGEKQGRSDHRENYAPRYHDDDRYDRGYDHDDHDHGYQHDNHNNHGSYKGRYYGRHESDQDLRDIRRHYEESRRNSNWSSAYLPMNTWGL